MTRRYIYAFCALLVLGFAIASFMAWWNWPKPRPSILLAGSGAMQPLNQALLNAYVKQHPDVDVVVESGGSMPGLIAVKRGAIDIAAMSRDLSVAEDAPLTRSYLIAKSDLVLITNIRLPVASLSQAQVRGLFNGEIDNWKTVGGPDAPVHLLSRPADSAVRLLMDEMVLKGDDLSSEALSVPTLDVLLQWIESDPWAISYATLKEPLAKPNLKILAIEGVSPSRETIYSGRYPFTQSLYWVLYGESSAATLQALAFAQSLAGQALVDQNQLIRVR